MGRSILRPYTFVTNCYWVLTVTATAADVEPT